MRWIGISFVSFWAVLLTTICVWGTYYQSGGCGTCVAAPTATMTTPPPTQQTPNAHCFAVAPSGTTVAWGGDRCTVAYTPPNPPTMTNPLIISNQSPNNSFGGHTVSGNGTISSSTAGSNDGPAFNSAFGMGRDIEIMSPGSGKYYTFTTSGGQNSPDVGLGQFSGHSVRCCTDKPNFNCSSNNPTDYDPVAAGWAIGGFMDSSTNYAMFQSGGAPGAATNVTFWGCQFIGFYHDLTAPPSPLANCGVHQQAFTLIDGSNGLTFNWNVFNGLGGTDGAFDIGGAGTVAQNINIQWNFFEHSGTNGTIYESPTQNFTEEHNMYLDSNTDLEFQSFQYAGQTSGIVAYNAYQSLYTIAWIASSSDSSHNCTGITLAQGLAGATGPFAACHVGTAGGGPCNNSNGPDLHNIKWAYNIQGLVASGSVPPYSNTLNSFNECNYTNSTANVVPNNFCGGGGSDALCIPSVIFDSQCFKGNCGGFSCTTAYNYNTSCAAASSVASQTCSNQ